MPTPTVGRLVSVPVADRPDLVGAPTLEALTRLDLLTALPAADVVDSLAR